MGAVPKQKAGIASAVNGSTRLFGGTLGVAVIGSVAASLYTSRLTALLPSGPPDRAVAAAKGSVGGAAAAAQQLSRAGLAGPRTPPRRRRSGRVHVQPHRRLPGRRWGRRRRRPARGILAPRPPAC